MNWKETEISNFEVRYFFLGILPTLIVLVSLIIFGVEIFRYKNNLLVVALLMFSMPHFLLSIDNFKKNYKKEFVFKKIKTLYFLISLLVWGLLHVYLDNQYSILPLLILFFYQSYHYALQSYGIFRYFEGKRIYKNLFLLLGFFFFISLTALSIKEAMIIDESTFKWIEKIHLGIVSVLFVTTIFWGLLCGELKVKKDSLKLCTICIWFVWVAFSLNMSFLLFLPILHSLQYLPFFQKKMAADGSSKHGLLRNHLVINLVALFAGGVFLNLTVSSGIQKFLLGSVIVINLVHIYIDSIQWKINAK